MTMTYMTMEEQVVSHIDFLRKHDFVVEELRIESGFIRCHSASKIKDRGEICYQTKKNELRNGLIGLVTWARCIGGETKIHKTYGQDCSTPQQQESQGVSKESNQVDKIDGFWAMSQETGEAEYLLKKGVGYYGIRFRDEEYGKVAVIPMRDIMGRLRSYQVINPDGSKRYAKDIETKSLLHMLHNSINRYSIGIAESYVTAATCFELLGIAMVTTFSADNLLLVALALRDKYPDSEIVVFGDNDRHLYENKGKIAADNVKKTLRLNCQVLIPPFDGYPIDKKYSDWNDFVREVGIGKTREIIKELRNKAPEICVGLEFKDA